eukprot:tig00020537_g10254.t1
MSAAVEQTALEKLVDQIDAFFERDSISTYLVQIAIGLACWVLGYFLFFKPKGPMKEKYLGAKDREELVASLDKSLKGDAAPARKIRLSEVMQHQAWEDLWLIIDNRVYDVTEYVQLHPGGEDIMNGLPDVSAGFKKDHHPKNVWEIVKKFYIGDLHPDDVTSKPSQSTRAA